MERLLVVFVCLTLLVTGPLGASADEGGAAAEGPELLWDEQLSTAPDSMRIGPSGDLYVTGVQSDSAVVRRLDAAGDQIWATLIGSGVFDTVALTLDNTGHAFVAGSTNTSVGGPHRGEADSWLARVDRDGNVLWTVQFGAKHGDHIKAIATNAAGTLLVAVGTTSSNLDGGTRAHGFEPFIAVFDGDGDQLWLEQFPTDGTMTEVALDPAGDIYAAGISPGSGWFVRKFRGDGSDVWTQIVPTPVADLAVHGTRSVKVATAQGNDVVVRSLAASDGSLEWESRTDVDFIDQTHGVAVSPQGTTYVTGRTRPRPIPRQAPKPFDGILVTLDRSGAQVDVQRFGDTGHHESGTAIAVRGDGTIYVGGSTQSATVLGTRLILGPLQWTLWKFGDGIQHQHRPDVPVRR